MTPAPLVLALGACLALTPSLMAGDSRDELARTLVDGAFPGGTTATGRQLFLDVLASDVFLHEAVGPFDLHVYRGDGLVKASKAAKLLDRAAEGLRPAAMAVAGWFPGERGVVAGRRFPIVLADSDRDHGELGFDALLALLDRCEDEGYSGFKPHLAVFTPENLATDDVFTWEVLLVNTAHEFIDQHDKQWFEHGVGYAALNLLVNRLFAKGAWGPAPPWLKDGLLDELDIEAYGDAWIAEGESFSFSVSRVSWKNDGWSGFVPEGQSPPAAVTGPPPGMNPRLTQSVLSDDWLNRPDSSQRHWRALALDRHADVPASLTHMAAGQSFTNRDRAYARAVLHLLTELAPCNASSLLAGLDTESTTSASGMATGDPLPVVVARALGGLPEIDDFEAQTARQFLTRIDRPDLVARFEALGAGALLELTDHRAQADTLSRLRLPDRDMQTVFHLVLQVENFQELQEWELLGQVLDRATGAALDASRGYPKKLKARDTVAAAFRQGLAHSQP